MAVEESRKMFEHLVEKLKIEHEISTFFENLWVFRRLGAVIRIRSSLATPMALPEYCFRTLL